MNPYLCVSNQSPESRQKETQLILRFLIYETLMSFLIYKEWLVLSLQGKKRQKRVCFDYFKSELALRAQIYRLCSSVDHMHVDNIYLLTGFM